MQTTARCWPDAASPQSPSMRTARSSSTAPTAAPSRCRTGERSPKKDRRVSSTVNRLDLVVGPNGAGKSTFVELTLAPLLPGSAFVNADEIAKQRWPKDPASHAYQAARVAAETRAKLIELGASFIAETVFSHPSKLELIHFA